MTRDGTQGPHGGFTFAEVMVSMAIMSVALVGAVATFQVATQQFHQGMLASRAFALAESRIEAKRSARWDRLLVDDLDHDGQPDLTMRDDGQEGDVIPGDGVYSSNWEENGIHLRWTVTFSRPGAPTASGSVLLEATASYTTDQGPREVRISTLRANPTFVGLY
jgi:prepilin-type N-terminal cleavage/methylation domain-containing protein